MKKSDPTKGLLELVRQHEPKNKIGELFTQKVKEFIELKADINGLPNESFGGWQASPLL